MSKLETLHHDLLEHVLHDGHSFDIFMSGELNLHAMSFCEIARWKDAREQI